ncbi:hypothetical protein B1H58_19325 [Pantoea alhagi]|uniref:Uncharacterized protein n=1 Tax=Pantoea alhagi TaxID=1891675 RepID=A0A1W6BA94_9GAMM|nr:hypothetical protein B1H58_19325 [Pantoea alhagi]
MLQRVSVCNEYPVFRWRFQPEVKHTGRHAHLLLHKVQNVKAGDWFIVHSVAGGLGLIVTRWASRLGFKIIPVVREQRP